MNDATAHKSLKEKISQKLMNVNFETIYRHNNKDEIPPGQKEQLMFDQYKLLIESAHKIEERRSASNNIFLGINTLLASFLIRPTQLVDLHIKNVPLLILLMVIGMSLSWDWLKVTASYKKINLINYSIIQTIEQFLPTYIFSLRAEIETELEAEKPSNRGNIILIKENFLPKAFFLFYFIYMATVLFHFLPI